jgi:hypothetical protein
MNRRRRIQQQHERAVVADFLRWLKARRKIAFRIIAEPNPPEALIQSKRRTRWVEVVDAFWSGQWAKDQYSFANPGESHVSIGPGPHHSPDATFANNFVHAVSKKLAKSSYLPVAQKYGPGYLIVNIDYPLFGRRAHYAIRQLWVRGRPWPDRGCFRQVFLRIRLYRGYAFRMWEV